MYIQLHFIYKIEYKHLQMDKRPLQREKNEYILVIDNKMR